MEAGAKRIHLILDCKGKNELKKYDYAHSFGGRSRLHRLMVKFNNTILLESYQNDIYFWGASRKMMESC